MSANIIGKSRVLSVPYLAQPTDDTCQSTVLKMMAMYLERVSPSPAGSVAMTKIGDIKTTVNKGAGRPDTTHTNSHFNLKWWLEQRFPKLKFDLIWVNEEIAGAKVVGYIDRGSPVLMAVSHKR